MSSKQVSTSVYEDPYEKLEEQYRVAVDMRLENYAYADIAAPLGVKEGTVRKWFWTGGICYPAYQWKRKLRMEERQERFKEIETQLHEMAADAVIVIKKRLKKGSESAAFQVLEMAGFVPMQKIKAEVDMGDLDKVSEAIDKLSDYARRTITTSDEATS